MWKLRAAAVLEICFSDPRTFQNRMLACVAAELLPPDGAEDV